MTFLAENRKGGVVSYISYPFSAWKPLRVNHHPLISHVVTSAICQAFYVFGWPRSLFSLLRGSFCAFCKACTPSFLAARGGLSSPLFLRGQNSLRKDDETLNNRTSLLLLKNSLTRQCVGNLYIYKSMSWFLLYRHCIGNVFYAPYPNFSHWLGIAYIYYFKMTKKGCFLNG